jgi:alpha-L-rhamnosidase
MAMALRALFLASAGHVLIATAAIADPIPVKLVCEYSSNPIAVDAQQPRFGWSFETGKRRGERQTAYQVLVAADEKSLKNNSADLWDSGKVESDDNIQVVYAGKPLASDITCHWKVRVWDEHDSPGAYSEPAHFDTGLRTAEDWKGAAWIAWRRDAEWRKGWEARKAKELAKPMDPRDGWIYPKTYPREGDWNLFKMYRFHEVPYDPAPLFRKEFTLGKPLRRARAYICGLGYYELHLNGRRVGDRLLDPAWMDPAHHVCYVSYDVTSQLHRGANAIGVMLGRGLENPVVDDVWGFYKESQQPKLIFRLSVEYCDGNRTDVVSEPGWKVTGGPVVFDDPYRGEIYDGRKEVPDWDRPGLNEMAWDAAVASAAPGGKLIGQLMPAVKAVEEVHPRGVTNPEPGVWVFDLGHAIGGWARIQCTGPAGTEVLVRYSDLDRGKALPKPQGFNHPQQQHAFILRGQGVETLEPRFCAALLRYVVVSGVPGPMTADDLVGIKVHTAFTPAGEFECSSPLINMLQGVNRLTLLNASYSVVCELREKHGWFVNGGLTSHEAQIYNFDMASYGEKRIEDLFDAQDAQGTIPLYAPHPHRGDAYGTAPAAAAVCMPWNEYVYYGDRRILEANFEAMKRAVDVIANVQVKGGRNVGSRRLDTEPEVVYPFIVPDWCADVSAPKDGQLPTIEALKKYWPGAWSKEGRGLYGTAWFYAAASTLEKIARVLGHANDAEHFAGLAKNIQAAFEAKFFDPERRCYRGEVRDITEYLQSADAVPLYFGLVPKEKQAAIMRNLLASLAQRNDRHNTGYLGIKALMEVLPAFGAGDHAFRVAAQTNYPSWAHLILSKGFTTFTEGWEGGEGHDIFCSLSSYFYRWLAGIQPDAEHPGFRHFFIRPTFVKDLQFVRATYRCPSGLIESRWKRDDGRLILDAVVPPNTMATFMLPAADANLVTESGQPAARAQGVRVLGTADGTTFFSAASGSYRFELPDKSPNNTNP